MSSSSATWYHSSCQCSTPGSSKVLRFQWREVPLSATVNLAFTGLKVLSWTVGIVPTALCHLTGNGYKSNTHDCVEIKFKCDSCGKTSYRVIEMDSDGKHLTNTYYAGDGYKRSCNVNDGALTYSDVRDVFNSSKRYPSWKSTYNCGHYAKDIYWDLYNR